MNICMYWCYLKGGDMSMMQYDSLGHGNINVTNLGLFENCLNSYEDL